MSHFAPSSYGGTTIDGNSHLIKSKLGKLKSQNLMGKLGPEAPIFDGKNHWFSLSGFTSTNLNDFHPVGIALRENLQWNHGIFPSDIGLVDFFHLSIKSTMILFFHGINKGLVQLPFSPKNPGTTSASAALVRGDGHGSVLLLRTAAWCLVARCGKSVGCCDLMDLNGAWF